MKESGIAPDNNIYSNITNVNQLQVSYLTDDNFSSLPLSQLQELAMQNLTPGLVPEITMQAGSENLTTYQKDFFGLAFPYLFPFKKGCPNSSIKKKIKMDLQEEITHFMLKWNGRGRPAIQLLMTAFDIIQWRQCMQGIQACVKKISPQHKETLFNMTTQDIEEAIVQKISGNYSHKITSAIYQSMKIISKVAPFSQISKRQNLQELYSTLVNKGSPSFYLTMTPDETKHPLAYVLQLQNPQEFDFQKDYCMLTNKHHRQEMARENPVACSLFFHKIVSEILQNFCNTSEKGLFGEVSAYYGMVETQARGTLHIHILIWLKNDIPKLKLYNMLTEDMTLEEKMVKFLDTIIQADYLPVERCVDTECHLLSNHKNMSYHPSPKIDEHFTHNAAHILYHAIESYQFHIHTLSCKKNDCNKCRYRKPALVTPQTYFDPTTGSFHTRCADGLVNFHNWLILMLTNSNMDLSFLHSGKNFNIRNFSYFYIHVYYQLHMQTVYSSRNSVYFRKSCNSGCNLIPW